MICDQNPSSKDYHCILNSPIRQLYQDKHPRFRVVVSSAPFKESTAAHDRNALIHNPLANAQVIVHPLLNLGRFRDTG